MGSQSAFFEQTLSDTLADIAEQALYYIAKRESWYACAYALQQGLRSAMQRLYELESEIEQLKVERLGARPRKGGARTANRPRPALRCQIASRRH